MNAQAVAAIKQVDSQMRGLQKTGSSAGQGFMSKLNLDKLVNFGKNLQWTGRQLEYNFTLPIVAAGLAAGKWSNDVEAALTKVQKVYGDLDTTQSQAAEAVAHLRKAFEALSNIFGVHQKDVAEIAALWASAGAQGVQLAKITRQTIETMILGEMDQEKATKSLMTIMGSYKLSVDQLRQAIEVLNVVENETKITLPDLIDGFTRAGSVAATVGVDVNHLAAMLAALVPQTGSAATAGNGLKTMLSRLFAPTKQIVDVLAAMGINVKDASWQMQNGTQRVETLAKKYGDLTQAQQLYVASILGSRFQINRIDALFKDIIDRNGEYQKALKDTTDADKNHIVYMRELNTVLMSSPQAWKILTTQLQNAMINVIGPMMPAIIAVVSRIVQLATAFSNLSPQTQQWILLGLMMLAVLGPILRYMGAFATVIGLVKDVFIAMTGVARIATGAIASSEAAMATMPEAAAAASEGTVAGLSMGWVALAAVVAAALVVVGVIIRDNWRGILDWLVQTWHKAWNALPASVQNALMSVARVIASAMHGIIDMLSYLNPFAKHSPSLVDQVTAGTTEIANQYAGTHGEAQKKMASTHGQIVGKGIDQASTPVVASNQAYAQVVAELAKINAQQQAVKDSANQWLGVILKSVQASYQLAKAAQNQFDAIERAQQRADILTIFPNAGPALDAMERQEAQLKQAIEAANQAVEAQQKVVDNLANDLAAAEAALDKATTKLNDMKTTADNLKDSIQQAKDHITELANTPITGMKAMDDAIFALDIDAKKLQLTINRLSSSFDEGLFQNDMAVKKMQLAMIQADGLGSVLNQQIYDNTQEQKKLQLQILQTQQQMGAGAEDASQKLSDLQGEIERLQAMATNLRLAGAGSEITGPILAQVEALKSQQRVVAQTVGPLDALQKQLDVLSQQGQILNLQHDINTAPMERQLALMQEQGQALSLMKDIQLGPLQHQLELLQTQGQNLQLLRDITFDPLVKQINDLVNAQNEMDFGAIVAGIKQEQDHVKTLTTQYDSLNQQIVIQQEVVDQLKAHRDAVNATYQTEKDKLEGLKNTYSDLKSVLSDLEQQYNSVAQAASQEISARKPKAGDSSVVQEQFDAAASGDFQPATGSGIDFGAGGSLADIDALTKQWNEEVKRAFGNFDMFAPIKEQFRNAWQWVKENVGGPGGVGALVGTIAGGLIAGPWGAVLGGSLGAVIGKPVAEAFSNAFGQQNVGDAVQGPLESIGGWFQRLWNGTLQPFFSGWKNLLSGFNAGPMLDVFRTIGSFVGNLVKQLGDEFKNWGQLFAPAQEALGHLWSVVKGVLGTIQLGFAAFMVAVQVAWKIFWPVLEHVAKPILDALASVVRATFQIIRGIIQALLALINGDFKGFADGVTTILNGLWDAIIATVKGFWGAIVGLIRGIIEGIIGVFEWLWEKLVGHSIIPDLIDEIIRLWNLLTAPIKAVLDAIVAVVTAAFNWILDNIVKPVMSAIGTAVGFYWNTVIKPIFDALKWYFENVLGPVFHWLYDNVVKPVMDAIGGAISFAWDNVIKPVWDAFMLVITGLGIEFNWLHDKVVKPVMDGIGTIVSFAWNNVMKPIFDGMKWFFENILNPAFDGVKTALSTAWDGIKSVTESVWNGVLKTIQTVGNGIIKAVNFIIRGINAITGAIPVINIPKIPEIPEISIAAKAKGGTVTDPARIGKGFLTNGPMAVVGEGRRQHPEYVIPTDPMFRGNALRLYQQLGAHLMAGGGILSHIPNPIDIGSDIVGGVVDVTKVVVDTAGNVISGVADEVAKGVNVATGAVKDAAGLIRKYGTEMVFAPFKAAADHLLDKVPISWIREPVKQMIDRVYDWVKGVNSKVDHTEAAVGAGGGAAGAPAGHAPANLSFNQALGQSMAANRGWGGSQWDALYALWMGESGWNQYADNPGSSAYGIPQSLPGSKMASKGADWLTNPQTQIAWGLDYIAQRYGSPVAAYNAWLSRSPHWYAQGGIIPAMAAGGIVTKPTIALIGEKGPEAVVPLQSSGFPSWDKTSEQIINQATSIFKIVKDVVTSGLNGVLTSFQSGLGNLYTGISKVPGDFGSVASAVNGALGQMGTATADFTSKLTEQANAVTALAAAAAQSAHDAAASAAQAAQAIQTAPTTVPSVPTAPSGTGPSTPSPLDVANASAEAFNQAHNITVSGTGRNAQRQAALANGWVPPVTPFDQGGWLRPGLTLAYNGTGRPERILPPNAGATRELHFHGDLVFPNVSDGKDAKGFIENLEALVD